MWAVEEPGWLFTPSNIGNVAWDEAETDAVDGNLLYPVAYTDTRTVAVVGHTGCGAVTAAYDAVAGGELPESPGVRRCVETLVPVVERGLETVDVPDDRGTAVDALVEYNVREQVAFLDASEEVPGSTTVLGFVYDLHDSYGGPQGRVYLVSADGTTDPERLAERADEAETGPAHVASLLR
jgi:carbonic anhydrase